MYRNIFLFSILTSIFISCGNVSDSVKDGIGSNIKEAITSLRDSITVNKAKLESSYSSAINKAIDSNTKKRIDSLHQSVTTTAKFIDTLIYEVDKLDNDDLNNVQVIKTIFLTHGKGDSLFNRINTSYQIAIDYTTNTITKSEINKSRTNLFGGKDASNFSSALFSTNSPLGVTMMLYGSEIELLHIGQNSLEN
jgi:hypothetical protein